MSLTQNEFNSFSEFAQTRLNNGGVESLEQCVRQWRQEQVQSDDVAAIRHGLQQASAGELRPFGDVDADICQKYGIGIDQ